MTRFIVHEDGGIDIFCVQENWKPKVGELVQRRSEKTGCMHHYIVVKSVYMIDGSQEFIEATIQEVVA